MAKSDTENKELEQYLPKHILAEYLGYDEYNIQKVQRIRYKCTGYHRKRLIHPYESGYDGTTVYDISCKGILLYSLEPGSKKWLNKHYYKVDPEEVRAFMDEMQTLSRQATKAFYRTDDCIHEVRFIYSGGHSEVFNMDLLLRNGDTTLIDQIVWFTADHEGGEESQRA